MRVLLLLVIVLCASIKEAVQDNTFLVSDGEFNGKNSVELLNSYEDNYNLRNLNDIKEKIKNSILHAWESFKVIAENADTKLEAWIEKVKEKVKNLEKAFEERLHKLREKFKEIVSKLVVTGDHIKECLQEDKNKIDTIYEKIVSDVKTCITNNADGLSKTQISALFLDESTFLKDLHNKLSFTCNENDEICLNDVRNEIFTEIENAKEDIDQKHLEDRNIADDHLDTTVTCVTEGLTMAAEAIVNETVQIIQCVNNMH